MSGSQPLVQEDQTAARRHICDSDANPARKI